MELLPAPPGTLGQGTQAPADDLGHPAHTPRQLTSGVTSVRAPEQAASHTATLAYAPRSRQPAMPSGSGSSGGVTAAIAARPRHTLTHTRQLRLGYNMKG